MVGNLQLTGKRFGRLVVLEEAGRDPRNLVLWRCICDCGNEFTTAGTRIKRGRAKSCGCLQKDRAGAAAKKSAPKRRTHGRNTADPTYMSWSALKDRCNNPNNQRFEHYGGRGISVCDRWKESFENFLEDMGDRPPGTTIDRVDVNGNYEPSNCRWATSKQQSLNKQCHTGANQ